MTTGKTNSKNLKNKNYESLSSRLNTLLDDPVYESEKAESYADYEEDVSDLVNEYCYEKRFSISSADLAEIERLGLSDDYDYWKGMYDSDPERKRSAEEIGMLKEKAEKMSLKDFLEEMGVYRISDRTDFNEIVSNYTELYENLRRNGKKN